ncbi:CaiB/BaiF CoA transferase family protein [Streptomyces sp. NPDC014806]|uniref:CaiB/BaiF CoA transferase family protein n=1 Tax=Streptomyces sp. NPDC014806 TaxID=3364920 RepID=UPI0036F71BCD
MTAAPGGIPSTTAAPEGNPPRSGAPEGNPTTTAPPEGHPSTTGAPESIATAAPLNGLRVLDLATLFAGPLAATLLGDFGAEVIKVEHPSRPDPSRGHGPAKDGVGLWWKVLGRNKRTVTLDLSTPGGRATLLRLAAGADVIVENFRPGTLEKWDLGWEELSATNPRLVLARVTAFGQFGPYAHRPGFGTLAEAMSGFAAITGEPDSPPTLPPFGLADSITALATAYAVMTALAARERTGTGQVVDMAIIEPILTVLGPQPTWYDQLGYVQERTGNRSANNAPRNTYRTADGTWVAVSASAQSVAERVMELVGRPELAEEPWFATGEGRARHAGLLDEAVGRWIAARTREEVLAAFEKAEAAIAPVQDVREIMTDPQYQALGTITTVDDPELGPLRMQNVLFRLSATPGAIRWAGRPHGADTDAVLAEAGLTPAEIAALRAEGAV